MAQPLLKIDGVDTRSFAHSNRRYTDEYTSVYIRRLRVEFNTSTRFCLTPRPSRDVLKQSCAKSICVLLLFLKLCFGTLRVLRAGLPRQLASQLSRYFSLDGKNLLPPLLKIAETDEKIPHQSIDIPVHSERLYRKKAYLLNFYSRTKPWNHDGYLGRGLPR